MTSVQTLRPCVEAFCKEASLPAHAEELEALGSEATPAGMAARLACLLREWGAEASAIAGSAQLKEDYSGPLLAMIDQRSWVYVARFASAQSEGTLALFDPRAGGYVTVKASQFLSRWQGPGIAFFSNESAPAAARRRRGGRRPELSLSHRAASWTGGDGGTAGARVRAGQRRSFAGAPFGNGARQGDARADTSPFLADGACLS